MDRAVKSLWRCLKSGLGTRTVGVERLLRDESGQDLIEYALVLCFIAMAAVATMKTLASNIGSFFGTVGTTLTSSV